MGGNIERKKLLGTRVFSFPNFLFLVQLFTVLVFGGEDVILEGEPLSRTVVTGRNDATGGRWDALRRGNRVRIVFDTVSLGEQPLKSPNVLHGHS